MAREGFMPFATTYAVLAARWACDFICLAIAEENLNVKIVCALPGFTTGYGRSHQATDDIAIFRGMPNITIIDPCDAHEIEQIVQPSPTITARSICGCCAGMCRWCSTNTAISSSWARPQDHPRRQRRAGHLLGIHDHARAGGRRDACR
jgi:hypothetical protein